MAHKKKKQPWFAAIFCSLCFVLLVFTISHILFSNGTISPYERNGLDRIWVTCDGEKNFISTQRYIGFEDNNVAEFKSYVDLPIRSVISCDKAIIEFAQKQTLLDRFDAQVFCGTQIVGKYGEVSSLDLTCDKGIVIEVSRR